MSYSENKKTQAISLREKGYSLEEIAKILLIAKSTASVWLSGIKLNSKALQRLQDRERSGQENCSA